MEWSEPPPPFCLQPAFGKSLLSAFREQGNLVHYRVLRRSLGVFLAALWELSMTLECYFQWCDQIFPTEAHSKLADPQYHTYVVVRKKQIMMPPPTQPEAQTT